MHILSCLLTFTVLFLLLLQSDGASDEQKREQMEKLVREELERWDSESSIGGSGRGTSPSASSRRGGASSSVSHVRVRACASSLLSTQLAGHTHSYR